MKYTYALESYFMEKWTVIVRDTRDFCLGYLASAKNYAPRNALRLIRSDGKVTHETPAVDEISIGQVASYPTPEQYHAAARRAIAMASAIQNHQRKEDARRMAVRNSLQPEQTPPNPKP